MRLTILALFLCAGTTAFSQSAIPAPFVPRQFATDFLRSHSARGGFQQASTGLAHHEGCATEDGHPAQRSSRAALGPGADRSEDDRSSAAIEHRRAAAGHAGSAERVPPSSDAAHCVGQL